MPTYDYRCGACHHEFELFQSMKDAPKRTCPACGKKSLERLIGTGAGVLFKGSGFYETDYRSATYKQAAKADGKSADTGAAKKNGSATGESGAAKPCGPACDCAGPTPSVPAPSKPAPKD